jgi:hypothetical protein
MDKNLILGTTADEMGEWETQEEINKELFYYYEQNSIFDCIPAHISRGTLYYLLENIDLEDIPFWEKVLKLIADNYFLEQLKYFNSDWNSTESFTREIKDILIYLKINLMDFILENKIDQEIELDEFQKILKNNNSPEPLNWTFHYISKNDFSDFINFIFEQYNDKYYEV